MEACNTFMISDEPRIRKARNPEALWQWRFGGAWGTLEEKSWSLQMRTESSEPFVADFSFTRTSDGLGIGAKSPEVRPSQAQAISQIIS